MKSIVRFLIIASAFVVLFPFVVLVAFGAAQHLAWRAVELWAFYDGDEDARNQEDYLDL